MMKTPSSRIMTRFSRGDASPTESRNVVRWLLLSGEMTATEEGAESKHSRYDGVLQRALGRANTTQVRLEDELPRAESLLAHIDEMPNAALADALAELGALAIFATPSCSRLLTERVARTVTSDPKRAALLANLATEAAARIPEARCSVHLAADVRATAWAHRANALRVGTNLSAAEEALSRAAELRAAGTGDPLVAALVLSFEGLIRVDQRRFEEGLLCYRRARRAARRVGDRHLAGRILIDEANVFANQGRDEEAIRLRERALAEIDVEAEPRLALVLRHNLVSYLDGAGRHDEAWQGLEAARTLAHEVGDSLDRVRLQWLEARIACHRGDLAHAEQQFVAARDVFAGAELWYDAALISLELAEVYLSQGETAKVKHLAAVLVPVFAARDVHREAQAALRVFCKAAEAETVGLALIESVRRDVEGASKR